jgi:hypothetical protein
VQAAAQAWLSVVLQKGFQFWCALQEEGLKDLVEYVQSLISERSSASYDELMNSFAQGVLLH